MKRLLFDKFRDKGNSESFSIPHDEVKEEGNGLYYGLTFCGRRKNNEDAIIIPAFDNGMNFELGPRCYYIDLPSNYYLFAVADGMGGASSGEVASELAVRVVKDYLAGELVDKDDIPVNQLKNILRDCLLKVQAEIKTIVQNDPSLSGMGTTMVILLIANNKYIWANIGDSRLYRIVNDRAELITKDHTYLQQYLDSHDQPPDEEWMTRYSSYLIRALDGTNSDPDIFPQDKDWENFPDNACFLLCSDGLTPGKGKSGEFPYAEIIKSSESPCTGCQQLISRAFNEGSTDNISVVLIEGPGYKHDIKENNKLPFPPGDKLQPQIKEENYRKPGAGVMHKKVRLRIYIILLGLLFSCAAIIYLFLNPFNYARISGAKQFNQDSIVYSAPKANNTSPAPALSESKMKWYAVLNHQDLQWPVSESFNIVLNPYNDSLSVKEYRVLIYSTDSFPKIIDSIINFRKKNLSLKKFHNLEKGEYRAYFYGTLENGSVIRDSIDFHYQKL